MIIESCCNKKLVKAELKSQYLSLTTSALSLGVTFQELESRSNFILKSRHESNRTGLYVLFIVSLTILGSSILLVSSFDDIVHVVHTTPCAIPNHYLIWEATRPVSDCSFCKNVSGPLILYNLTRGEFKRYAYSSHPMIIKRAFLNWAARKKFNFQNLKNMFYKINGSLDSKHGPCQFLHFKSDFTSLRDVFEMSEDRAQLKGNSLPWYVGWCNCDAKVLKELRLYYPQPHFLPIEAELPNAEYLFMGYEQGAIMHLDYVPRLMWQAQLRGHKHWSLAPTPECDEMCSGLEFDVEPGDAVLVDTRIWYHGTHILGGEFSVTVQSEYG